MNAPQQLRVGYKPVKLVTEATPPVPTDAAGYFHDAHREIFIDPTTQEHEQGLALLHEMVHLAIAEHDLSLDDDLEEAVCDAVSRTFAELMTRNPALFPIITEALT